MNLSGEGLDLGLTTCHFYLCFHNNLRKARWASACFKIAWSGEVVQWVRVFAVKPDNLTLTHGSHVMKGED